MKEFNRETTIANRMPEAFSDPSSAETEDLGALSTTRLFLLLFSGSEPALSAAEAIRGHWKIETTSHYSRDVTFGEDKSRIRTNPGVFARLRSFAFNILKSNKTSTLCQDRYRAALAGIDNLLEVLAIPER